MGDLNSLESSDTIKIAGANGSGQETNFVNASPNGDLQTTDIMNTAAVSGVISLTSTPVPLRINVSNLENRKYIILQGLTNSVVWGFSEESQPFDIFKNQFVMLPCGSNITLYAKVVTGTGQISVGELS
jgi:hypothetical protein